MTAVITTGPTMDVALADLAHVGEAWRASHASDGPRVQRREPREAA